VTQLESVLRRAIRDLDDAGAHCALVGGLAVSVWTEPRFTRDADLAVAVGSDAEAEALIHRLRGVGYDISALVEQDAVGRLATPRLSLLSHTGAAVVDLLFASSGIEQDIVREADIVDVLPGLTTRVARVGHLIAQKLLSRDDIERPQDAADIRALLRVATPEEVDLARHAVRLIVERRYHRGRDLVTALEEMLP
jgi:predicted nucleotidyltransferase